MRITILCLMVAVLLGVVRAQEVGMNEAARTQQLEMLQRPTEMSSEAEQRRCDGIKGTLKKYLESGNFRDMADEFRRGEVGFVTKRFAESCGLDDRWLPIIQASASRRSVLGAGLTAGFLAQRKYLRAFDAAFGLAEDQSLAAGRDPEAQRAAEQAGTVGAFMPVALDHQERWVRHADRMRAAHANWQSPLARAQVAAGEGMRNTVRLMDRLAGAPAGHLGRAERVLSQASNLNLAQQGQRVAHAVGKVLPGSLTVQAEIGQRIASVTRAAIKGGVQVGAKTGQVVLAATRFAPGVTQAASIMTKTVPILRAGLIGHAAYMTGKHLHDRNWRAAGKSALDTLIGGTGTTDLVVDAYQLAHQCITNATEQRCLQRAATGIARGGKAVAKAVGRAGLEVLKCGKSGADLARCSRNVATTAHKMYNWTASMTTRLYNHVRSEDTQDKWKERFSAAWNHTKNGVKALGKKDTWVALGKGTVNVGKEIAAIARDGHLAFKNTTMYQRMDNARQAARRHVATAREKVKETGKAVVDMHVKAAQMAGRAMASAGKAVVNAHVKAYDYTKTKLTDAWDRFSSSWRKKTDSDRK